LFSETYRFLSDLDEIAAVVFGKLDLVHGHFVHFNLVH
jgi:hypothetical protein